MPRTLAPHHALLSVACLVLSCCLGGTAEAQLTPYNPYAESQEVLPPVAPDGTIQWGTFYKSVSLQNAYARLWALGACRGTRRAITEPVENNKLHIDRLPETQFKGVVHAASGSLAGGVIAFSKDGASPHDDPLFVQLHPAGVSKLSVSGRAAPSVLATGMTVRVLARVDERGRGTDAIRVIDIVTLPDDFEPDEVRPNRIETVVGTVVGMTKNRMILQVDGGRIRRITLSLAPDAIAMIDASELRLIAAGDTIQAKGRLWSGPGSAGAGTVFASHVTVTKPEPPSTDSPRP